MSHSTALTLHYPSSPTTLSRRPISSLVPSDFFTMHTGHAIATQLLCRILANIFQHFLNFIQQFAYRGLDGLNTFVQRRMEERWAAAQTAMAGPAPEDKEANAKAKVKVGDDEGANKKKEEGLGIMEQVMRRRDGPDSVICSVTGEEEMFGRWSIWAWKGSDWGMGNMWRGDRWRSFWNNMPGDRQEYLGGGGYGKGMWLYGPLW